MRMENHSCSQRSVSMVGWMSRNNLRSGRGEAFFLTSLFIELIDSGAYVSQRVALYGAFLRGEQSS
jgi:hypothetical protein